MHVHDHRRSRVAEGAGGRVLAVRAHAGAARGADRPARSCSTRRWRSTTGCSPTCGSSAVSPRRCREVRVDPEQMKRVHHQPDRQRHRGHRAAAARSRSRRRATTRTASCAIVVADDGPGIPAAEREKLFLPYYSTKGRGSGLGLAIVRRIVAEHGGTVDVADNVPRGHAVYDRAAMRDSHSCLMPVHPGRRRRARRALVASSGVLRDEGFDVEAVGTGEACLERVAQRPTTSSCSTSGCPGSTA